MRTVPPALLRPPTPCGWRQSLGLAREHATMPVSDDRSESLATETAKPRFAPADSDALCPDWHTPPQSVPGRLRNLTHDLRQVLQGLEEIGELALWSRSLEFADH